MTHITLPRATVEQAIGLICSARLCEVNSMSSRQEMLRLLIEATDILRAALAQQAEPTPPDATAGLVDDLCLLHMGWVSDAEGVLHRAAMGRVIARATEVRRLRKIEQLKAQVAQMEGNT